MLRSPLLHFLLAGLAILAIQRIGAVVLGSSTATVVELRRSEIDARIEAYQQQMRRPANAEEAVSIENGVIDDALWLEQAWALGLADTDSVVRERLVGNMRFLGASDTASDEALLALATELGMAHSDRVVRRRLIDRVQSLIRDGVRARPPTEERLRTFHEEHAARWREPVRIDFSHVYFSRDARGDARVDEARALLRTLGEAGAGPESADDRGDAFPAGRRLRDSSESRIATRFGPAFTARVVGLPAGQWSGPVESAFGTHLVFVHERIESRVPPFEDVRGRVLEEWIEAESRRALRRELDRRRELVEVRIIEDVDRATSIRDGAS